MARRKNGRNKYEHRKPPIPKGTPQGMRLLLENKKDYPCIVEALNKCCAAHLGCKYKEECRRLYDTRCNKWYLNEKATTGPTKEQSTESVVIVIPPTNHEEIIEAIENQLSKAIEYQTIA